MALIVLSKHRRLLKSGICIILTSYWHMLKMVITKNGSNINIFKCILGINISKIPYYKINSFDHKNDSVFCLHTDYILRIWKIEMISSPSLYQNILRTDICLPLYSPVPINLNLLFLRYMCDPTNIVSGSMLSLAFPTH